MTPAVSTQKLDPAIDATDVLDLPREDTGLEWVTPHTFRKTVATLISERVDAETASQQLGHSSPAITREFYISKSAIAATSRPTSPTCSKNWLALRMIELPPAREYLRNSAFGFK